MTPTELWIRKLLVRAPSAHTSALLAVVLRVLWSLGVPNAPVADCFIYHVGAVKILSGDGFAFYDGSPNGFWPPGYSYFVALMYSVLTPEYWAAYLGNVLLAVALVYIVRTLGQTLHSKWAGRMAALLVAVYPTFIMYSTLIASENLYNVLVALFLLVAVPLGAPGLQLGRCIAVGTLCGVAILVSPGAQALPAIVLAIGLIMANRGERMKAIGPALLRTAIVTAFAVLVCVPQGLRNLHEFGEFRLSSFSEGSVLWMGNHDGPDTATMPEWTDGMPLAERERVLGRQALEYIERHPDIYMRRMLERIYVGMVSETIAVHWNEPGLRRRFGVENLVFFKLVASAGYWAVALVFFIVFFLRSKAKRFSRSDGLLFVMLGVNLLPIVLISSQNRYHLPMVSFAMLYIGQTLAWRFNRRRLRRSGPPPGMGAAVDALPGSLPPAKPDEAPDASTH